jgi:hypothetical protein
MAEIISTKGHVILVDDCDLDRLLKFAWSVHYYGKNNMYATTSIKGSTIYMHRVVIGAKQGDIVDHKNRNGLDNRSSNLRLCTKQQNLANRGKQSNNTSGYKGVTWNKQRKKWQAQIKVSQQYKSLGIYPTKEQAHSAYKSAAIYYFGEYSCT